MQGLVEITQEDFAAGMVRAAAPHLIPSNGVWDILDGLLDDDGSVYGRGGSEYKSAPFGASGIRFVWDGHLAAGPRTFLANGDDFGVLDADDATVLNLGGIGLVAPVLPVVLRGVLYLPGGVTYGGSRLSSSYSAGTVDVTNGSTTVTGAGTSWASNIDTGMIVTIGGRSMAVAGVTDDTHLDLVDPWSEATATGLSYTASPLGQAPRTSDIYATVAGRLISCEGARIYESAIGDPHTFPANEFWELPGGVEIIGAAASRGLLFVFSTDGLWTVAGLLNELEDAYGNVQQQLEQVNHDLILWGPAGISGYSEGLIVPAADGVWLLGAGQPELLSRSITPVILEYVAAGYQPGQGTVHRGHYFLPVLDTGGNVVDLLVCRLNRPTRTRMGTVFPWSRLTGRFAALAQRVGTDARQPVLLGGDRGDGSRLWTLDFFGSTATTDADGLPMSPQVISRDYATGNGFNENQVRRVRVRYELEGDAALTASYGAAGTMTGGSEWGIAEWGSGEWTDADDVGMVGLEGEAPADEGDDPFVWKLSKRARYLRIKIRASAAYSRLVIRSVELFVRPSGKQ